MDLDRARSFLADHHRAVLLTRRSGGGPQMSPVVCGLDTEGRVNISTRETAAKTRNARQHPDVALCVIDDQFFGEWIQVEGRAEVIPLPEAMDGLVEVYRAVAGEHPDWDDFRAAMERERRVLLRIDVQRAGPDRHG